MDEDPELIPQSSAKPDPYYIRDLRNLVSEIFERPFTHVLFDWCRNPITNRRFDFRIVNEELKLIFEIVSPCLSSSTLKVRTDLAKSHGFLPIFVKVKNRGKPLPFRRSIMYHLRNLYMDDLYMKRVARNLAKHDPQPLYKYNLMPGENEVEPLENQLPQEFIDELTRDHAMEQLNQIK